MGFHFAPIGGIDIRWEHHQPFATGIKGGFGHINCFGSRQGGDAGDDGAVAIEGRDGGFVEGDFFVYAEGCAFAQGATRDHTHTTGGLHPLNMLVIKAIVDTVIAVEGRRDSRDYAAPIDTHCDTPFLDEFMMGISYHDGYTHIIYIGSAFLFTRPLPAQK